MFKMAFRLAFFVAGAGAGIWLGNKYPIQAANISAAEEARTKQAVASAQKSLIQQFVSDAQTMTTTAAPAPGAGFLGGGGASGAASPLAEKWQQRLNQIPNQ
jgi:hypothetical protein